MATVDLTAFREKNFIWNFFSIRDFKTRRLSTLETWQLSHLHITKRETKETKRSQKNVSNGWVSE
jgi:hypothetical protein